MERALQKFQRRRLFGRPYKLLAQRAQRRDIAAGGPAVQLPLLNGRILFIEPHDLIARRVYRYGAYEFEHIYLLYALGNTLARLGVAMDIGANLGTHTLFFADFFETVHAFEPNPGAHRALSRNVTENRLTNVELHALALSDENATVKFVVPPSGHHGLGHIRSAQSDSASANDSDLIDVEARKGDDVLPMGTKVDCLKLDIEGHEITALRGLHRILTNDCPYILLEYLPDAMNRDGGFDALQDVLPGYRIFVPAFSDRGSALQKLQGLLGHYTITLTEIVGAPTDFCRLVALHRDAINEIADSKTLRIKP